MLDGHLGNWDGRTLAVPVVCELCGTTQMAFSKVIGVDYGRVTAWDVRCRGCGRVIHVEGPTKDLAQITLETLSTRKVHQSPNVFFERNDGTHFTDTLGTPVEFGSLQAGGSSFVTVYVDNEATGGGSNDLQNPSYDGTVGATQLGVAADTYNAVRFRPAGTARGATSNTYFDPWDNTAPAGSRPIGTLPADGDAGTREKVRIKWHPGTLASVGTKQWGMKVTGVFA